MNMNFSSAVSSTPEMSSDTSSTSLNSLFQVIQGAGTTEIEESFDGVFAQILGYNQEQMAEIQQILTSQDGEESPIEHLEEWMASVHELLTQLGVQLEQEGFQMNAQAFAQNIIQSDGQGLDSLKDLQNLLMTASEDAQIPVFIQSQLAISIQVTSPSAMGRDDLTQTKTESTHATEMSGVIDSNDINSSLFAFKAVLHDLSSADRADEWSTIRKAFRQLADQSQDDSVPSTVNQQSIEGAYTALKDIVKALLAKLEKVEKTITTQDENWAMDAAQAGFQASEIQFIAHFKTSLSSVDSHEFELDGKPAESTPHWLQLKSQVSDSLNGDSLNYSSHKPVLLSDENQQELNSHRESVKMVSVEDSKLNRDHPQPKQESIQSIKIEANSSSQTSKDEGESSEKHPEHKDDNPQKAPLVPKMNPGVEVNSLPDEQTFTNIKTDSKGNLILEKITQTQSSSSSNAPKHPVVRQIETQVSVMFEKGESRTTITLNPDNLGRVEMEIKIHQDKMQLMVSVENDKVKSILESNLNQLKDHLTQHNLHLDKSEVTIDYRQAGQQGKHDAHHKGFGSKNRGHDKTLIVEVEAHEGDETGRRLGYNTMEYLA